MFKKILQEKSSKISQKELDELRSFCEEIDAKQKEIASKKAAFKEERESGARITKHRFTI